jgi:hypothetical protein
MFIRTFKFHLYKKTKTIFTIAPKKGPQIVWVLRSPNDLNFSVAGPELGTAQPQLVPHFSQICVQHVYVMCSALYITTHSL